MALASVNRSTLREKTLGSIREAILTGTLRPGSILRETELADSLGVSRGTVREALRSLQQNKLVVGEERASLRVNQLSPEEVVNLFQVRAALEGLAVQLMMSRPDAKECIDFLEKQLPPEDGCAHSWDCLEADLLFHESLIDSAQNPLLLDMWLSAKDMMWLVVLGANDSAPNDLTARAYHQPIIDAIKKGDSELAVAALTDHMQTASNHWAQETPKAR